MSGLEEADTSRRQADSEPMAPRPARLPLRVRRCGLHRAPLFVGAQRRLPSDLSLNGENHAQQPFIG
jgi:hypothetical protein